MLSVAIVSIMFFSFFAAPVALLRTTLYAMEGEGGKKEGEKEEEK